MPGNFCPAFFVVVWMMNHKLQIQTGAYGIPVCLVLLHCIRTLRTGFRAGFEMYSRHIQIPFKGISSLIQYLILVEVTRTRFETQAFTRFTVHELRQERSRGSRVSTFTRFNFHETFTIPIWNVHEPRRGIWNVYEVHEVHRSLGPPSIGTFTRFTRTVYELCQERLRVPLERITNPDGA